MEFIRVQEETCLVAKNFVAYKANVETLQEALKPFNIKVKPFSPSRAWTMTRRRMERRTYLFGKVSFIGNINTGWKLYAGDKFVAYFELVGENLHFENVFASDDKVEIAEAKRIVRDTVNLFTEMKNSILTEKITAIVNAFLKKEGATPLRAERGDFYLVRDTERLRNFIQKIEECNENHHRNCFIIAKVDTTTIGVIANTFLEKLSYLKRRLNETKPQDRLEKHLRNLIEDARQMLVSLESLGDYLFIPNEKEIYRKTLENIIEKANKKIGRKRVTRRKIMR